MVSVCVPSDALSQHLPSYLGFSYLGQGLYRNLYIETYIQVRKQQLELDMEQQTGSKQEKECIKAVYVTLLI